MAESVDQDRACQLLWAMYDVLEVCNRAVDVPLRPRAAQLDDLSAVTTRHQVDLITGTTLGEADGTRGLRLLPGTAGLMLGTVDAPGLAPAPLSSSQRWRPVIKASARTCPSIASSTSTLLAPSGRPRVASRA